MKSPSSLEIEASLDRVAFEIGRPGVDGPTLYPIYERLERDLVAAKQREADNMTTADAVKRRLSSLSDASQSADRKAAQSFAIPFAAIPVNHPHHILHG